MLDPFAGGGSIPLEAQRLGLAARASDLNPVAVLINKVLLEVAASWADRRPVHALAEGNCALDGSWEGTRGLAEDVRYYSDWILERARETLAPLYPTGPGGRAAVAWIWCRTVASPNPACRGLHVPLLRSLKIASGKASSVWLEPIVDRAKNEWHFQISNAKPSITTTVGRRGGTCILSQTPIPLDYIRSEGKAGRLGLRLVAIVSEGRQYHKAQAWPETPKVPATDPAVTELMPHNPFAVRPPLYGLLRFCDVFTTRQLNSLRTLSALVKEAREKVREDASASLGAGPAASYADAVSTLLAFIVDRCVDFNSSLCRGIFRAKK